MKSILFFTACIFGGMAQANAQGCVAIRSTGGMCVMDHAEMASESGSGTASKWLFNANSRYFNSYKHFVGTEEQKHRVEAGTQVINHSYTLDLAVTRLLSPRWSVSADLPIISNTRSSLYEHGGKERHTTSSFGIGDIRVWANYWLLDPAKHRKANIQLGLGLKLATGNYRYTGRFYTATGTTVTGPVDQSIQLGDGGTGVTTEINAYYNIARRLGVYGNFYYLINPQEVNGTSSARGGTPSATAVANGSDVMAVPDQYMLRAGVNYSLNRFLFSAGVRKECVPVHDLIGGSIGYRRPGYVVSVEPGITYSFHTFSLYAYVPVAIERNRTQSMADKITTDLTGKYTQGDAAFADYAVNIGITLKL
ncbi:hypothetical protein [Sediminibacterium soli]|uniref:hypothetical protein n=1 Tax=Sediminibacterium soli TaxID=2698829 RepID=UPI00137AEBFA|nr:hypothetical protein [Sediminibacterium soli]NCI47380.1 hypothetical protein [Sediminibacterium soli]